MNKYLIKNYKLIIGVIIGLVISKIEGFHQMIYLLNISQYFLYFLALLYFLSFNLIELLIYFNNKEVSQLQILEVNHNKNMRCLKITMVNNSLLEGEDLFKGIYKTLMNNKDFLNFGFQKIIILSCVLEDFKEFNLHSNTLIDNDTTFTDYYQEISNDLQNYNNLEYGYHNLNIVRFVIKAWNCDNLNNLNIKITNNSITMERQNASNPNKLNLATNYSVTSQSRHYSTSNKKHWSKGLITPLSLVNKNGKLKLEHPAPIFTMDLETINYNNIQTPIAISSCL